MRRPHPRTGSCPLEGQLAHALDEADVLYHADGEPGNRTGLDFYLPAADIYIEVKSGSTPRIAAQMERASNIIVIQGIRAMDLFCQLLKKQ